MFTKPGHHIGDTWYQVDGDTVHLFYLTCPDSIPRHERWSIGHAVSADLVTWRDEGVILSPGAAGDWDGVCPATGSVLRHDGAWWMAYTGDYAGPVPTVGMAVSEDLHRWEKLDGNPVLCCDNSTYSLAPNAAWSKPRWRDPFLFAEDGVVHALVTAATSADPTVGVVAHATSTDLRTWELLPPLDTPPIASDLECPKLHRVGDRYVLTVSIQDGIALPALRERQTDGQAAMTAYCLTAHSLEGPYTLHGDGRILGASLGPYACEPVEFRGAWYLLGTVWDDQDGDRVCDQIPLEITVTGFRERSSAE